MSGQEIVIRAADTGPAFWEPGDRYCRSRKLGLRANQGNTAHVRSGCIDGGFDVDA